MSFLETPPGGEKSVRRARIRIRRSAHRVPEHDHPRRVGIPKGYRT